MACRTILAGWMIAGFLSPLYAQQTFNRRPAQPQGQTFQADGLIEAIAAGKIQMITNANQNMLVVIQPQTKIRLTGTASPEFLRPGMFVSFTAAADKRGNVREKVGHLTVFTPDQDNPLGATAVGGNSLPEAAVQGGKPAAKPSRKTAAVSEQHTYAVAGQLTGIHGDKCTVKADNITYKLELLEDAKIDVNVTDDYTLARKGDKISVRGRIPPSVIGRKPVFDAIKIEAASPFSVPAGKSKAAATR